MGRRGRRRATGGGAAAAATTDYEDSDGNVLTLRDALPAGLPGQLEALERKPAASEEDRWQRQTEFLFERLAVRWTIAGLPLERQRELLGRYRLADSQTRSWVRKTLDRHVESPRPDSP